ncbi:ABC transporter permease [Dongia soli]|uniref:ABC transporter permease n=1 Tax=Dongia soli TaxID=600628 RepID=A0ABU5EDV3_9PROT|nr:ABC transporter permease [Dongia soli]MDY0884393.1 ABC transporter permease [Dongia soli]
MDISAFLASNWHRILDLTLGHIELSLYAVGISLAIGLPLGVLCYCVRWIGAVVLNLVSVIYTVPTLALFGLMIPLLGIGILPAIVAVVLYSLLPVVQGTYTGLTAVAPEIRESATGIGMSYVARLWRVELPLALPVVFAGLRVAVVNAVGMMTLASLIGAGGLGDMVFRGISTVSWALVLAGSIPVLLLAIIADLGLRTLERRFAARQA